MIQRVYSLAFFGVCLFVAAVIWSFGLVDAQESAQSETSPATLDEVRARAAQADYEAARWDPLHFKPAIDRATDEQCLVCHQDILERTPLETSPAGVSTSDALAWYQTLDTYEGDQETFHRRHIVTSFAQQVMNLQCNFCHQGNDPREEAPAADVAGPSPFTLRKVVNTSETCLLCHGSFPWQIMAGLEGPWHEVRELFEDEEFAPNGCLVCHEELFRTVRHQVSYLNAQAIEEMAKEKPDSCYGCHGGRAWYRVAYPYPRHPWPDMPEDVPDWAVGRPTESDPRYRVSGQ